MGQPRIPVNRVLTLLWGLAFLATAVLGYIAVIAPSTSDWTNWILPMVLIVGAVEFTARHPQRGGASGGEMYSWVSRVAGAEEDT